MNRSAAAGIGAIAVILTVLTGCQTDSPVAPASGASATSTPSATTTPESPPLDILPPAATPTPTPVSTPTPLPPATPSGLWVFDLGRGQQALLYEGDAAVDSRIEASGNVVTVLVTDGDGSSASRFRTNGDLIESHDDRGMIVSSSNGEYRFSLDISDADVPALVLEYQGDVVRLEGTRPRLGVSFSPAGDRLLTVSERPGQVVGEVVRTYSVHQTVDGRLRMQFEHRAILGSEPIARWSPSGRYVADEGIEGLFVRDTVTGRAWRLGPGGSARWSPAADRLLAISDLGRLAVVNVPELDGIDLGPVEGATVVQFDRSGLLAIVSTYANEERRVPELTRAFEVESGTEVASWAGAGAGESLVADLDGVIALEGGIAAVFSSTACGDGFVVYHPALADSGRCLAGANPRWSPNAEFLVYAREREIVVLSASSDSERVIVRGTPPANDAGAPLLRWSPDGSWILIEWNASLEGSPTP